MNFKVDHDLHIHTHLSLCSNDPEQNVAAICEYAVSCGLSTVCITDHFWDSTVPGASGWYSVQDMAHISASLPLPSPEGVRVLFGCETDMDRFMTVGVGRETFDSFDFVLVPTTHLHMTDFTLTREDASSLERRAELWVSRFDALLKAELPFEKVGIAHLTCGLLAPQSREDYIRTLSLIPSEQMERLFARAAELGVGIELNASDMGFSEGEAGEVLRPYRIAKAAGCRFFCGSDAHHPRGLYAAKPVLERAVELLGLTEEDKFRPAG